jgi:hypothetical protein
MTYEKPSTMCRWGPAIEAAVGLHDLREDHRLVPIKRQVIPSLAGASSSRPTSVSRSASLAQPSHSFLLTGDLNFDGFRVLPTDRR